MFFIGFSLELISKTGMELDQELLPQVKAILILDEDGGRVSCKYHDRKEFPNLAAEAMFEHKLFRKTKSVSPCTRCISRMCAYLFTYM